LGEEIQETFTDFVSFVELGFCWECFTFPKEIREDLRDECTLRGILGIEIWGEVVLCLDGIDSCSGISWDLESVYLIYGYVFWYFC
jgi:hypothetical protein